MISNAKLAIGSVVIIALLVAGKAAYNAIYEAGWNAAAIEYDARVVDAERDAAAKVRRAYQSAKRVAEENIIVEEKIIEKVRTVEKKIPVVVERIVEITPECSDLGADFAGLLNAQIDSRAGASANRAGVSAKPDP